MENLKETVVFTIEEDENTTDDLQQVDPITRSTVLRKVIAESLQKGSLFYDPYNYRLTQPDDIVECLRRFGIVYARPSRSRAR